MDTLEVATWALVAATGLLVVATSIPVVSGYLERRRAKQLLAARLVPGMQLLRSRVRAAEERMVNFDYGEPRLDERADEDADELLQLLAELEPVGPHVSLTFTNELATCLHLLSQARHEVWKVRHWMIEGGSTTRRDAAVQRAGRLYRAAIITLDKAEAELPKRHRTVDGQSFHDRFVSVADARELEAERVLVEVRRQPEVERGG